MVVGKKCGWRVVLGLTGEYGEAVEDWRGTVGEDAAEGEGRTGGGGESEILRRRRPIPLPEPLPLVGGVATPACTPLTAAGLALALGTLTTPVAVLGRAVRRLLVLLDVLGLPFPLPPAVALACRCTAPAESGAVEEDGGGGVFRALLRSKNDNFPPSLPPPLGADGAVAETVTKDEAVESALSVESRGGASASGSTTPAAAGYGGVGLGLSRRR